VGKSPKNSLKECVFANLALKYSTILSKIHSCRLLFQRFCPLGKNDLSLSKTAHSDEDKSLIDNSTGKAENPY